MGTLVVNKSHKFSDFIKAIEKYLQGFIKNIKIWGTCIYFQFRLIPVNVDRVYI